MKKRVLSLFLAMTFTLGLLSGAAAAVDETDAGAVAAVNETDADGEGGTETADSGAEAIANASDETEVETTPVETEAADSGGETAEKAKTLQEQITAAGTTATTISLSANTNESITIAPNQDITLDLAGHTLTNAANQHTIINNGELTITDSGSNGTILNSAVNKSALQNEPGGTVVIDGGTLKKELNANNNDYYVITNHGDSITINGGTITSASSHSSAIENGWYTPSENSTEAYSELVINSGSVSNTGVDASGGLYTLKNDDYGKMTINGGTFENTTSGAGTVLNWNELTITDGVFTASNASVATMCESSESGSTTPKYAYEQGKTTIKGGTFTGFLGSSVNYSKAITVTVSGGTFSDLSFAPYAVKGASVKLSKEVTLTEAVEVTKDLTLDLNGHDISGTDTRVFHVKSGTLTLTNSGSGGGKVESTHTNDNTAFLNSSSVIRVGDGSGSTADGSKVSVGLVIDSGVTVSSAWCYGVTVFGAATSETVTVEGEIAVTGDSSALSGNGSSQYAGTVINIEDGAKVSASNAVAIYHPQSGTLNVKGGTVTGGIEMKAGTLNVTGTPSITANNGTKSHIPSGNGPSTKNYAVVAVKNNAYAGNPAIAISGGSIIGPVDIVTDDNADTTASISITGGTFSIDPSKVLVSEDSSDTVSYVASGYQVTRSGSKWAVSRVPSSSSSSSTPSTTTTTTTQNEDGSTTTTTTNRITGAVTVTTENPDGSSTKVETEKDGTVTTTETAADGSTATTVASPDGSSQTEVQLSDGTTASIATDAEGNTRVQVTVSDQAVATAAEEGVAVALPIPAVEAVKDAETAQAVEVTVPETAEAVKVEIPVIEPTPGSVAVIVHEDGTEEVVKTSLPTEEGVALTLEGSATVKIVDNSKDFPDVAVDHWAKDCVAFVSARQLFQGDEFGNFTPEGPMTRGMVAVVLHNFENDPDFTAETTFTDVASDAWYAGAVEWAASQGIVSGYGNGLYGAEDNTTREQFVTILYRYTALREYNVTGQADLSQFADAGSVSGFAGEAMRWAVGVGLIKGDENGFLAPQGAVTRAQVAAILERYLKLL